MAITAVFEVPGFTAAQYNQVIKDLEKAGQGKPKGRTHHSSSIMPGGFYVVDLWESQEKLDKFAQVLMPILVRNGVTPPQPKIMPTHNVIKG